MFKFLRELLWFGLVAGVCSYVCMLLIGSVVEVYAAITTKQPVSVRDRISPGIHQLSGMIMVENTCDELLQHTERISPTQYEIVFSTWQEPASASCAPVETPRAFHAMLPAPAFGVSFTARLDDKALPLAIIRDVATTAAPLPDEQ